MEPDELALWWRDAAPEQRQKTLRDNPWMRGNPAFSPQPANTATTGKRAPETGVARPPEAEIGDVRPDVTAPRPKRNDEEARLVRDIIEAAHLHGWICYHQRPARTGHGYRTALQGHAGFPDLVLVHPAQGRFLFCECKSTRGKLSPSQTTWRDAVRNAIAKCWKADCPVEYYIIRPADWPEICGILEKK